MACIVHMSVLVRTAAPCSICTSVSVFVVSPCPYGRTTVHAAASWHHRVESLLLHWQFPLSTTLSSTVTRKSHGAATSSSVSCPQVSSQVQTSPTCTVTSELMSATLAEAATQLSFSAFLERCISVRAPPPTHPHPTSGCRHVDYSTHRCLPGRFYTTLAWGVLSQICPPA